MILLTSIMYFDIIILALQLSNVAVCLAQVAFKRRTSFNKGLFQVIPDSKKCLAAFLLLLLHSVGIFPQQTVSLCSFCCLCRFTLQQCKLQGLAVFLMNTDLACDPSWHNLMTSFQRHGHNDQLQSHKNRRIFFSPLPTGNGNLWLLTKECS